MKSSFLFTAEGWRPDGRTNPPPPPPQPTSSPEEPHSSSSFPREGGQTLPSAHCPSTGGTFPWVFFALRSRRRTTMLFLFPFRALWHKRGAIMPMGKKRGSLVSTATDPAAVAALLVRISGIAKALATVYMPKRRKVLLPKKDRHNEIAKGLSDVCVRDTLRPCAQYPTLLPSVVHGLTITTVAAQILTLGLSSSSTHFFRILFFLFPSSLLLNVNRRQSKRKRNSFLLPTTTTFPRENFFSRKNKVFEKGHTLATMA